MALLAVGGVDGADVKACPVDIVVKDTLDVSPSVGPTANALAYMDGGSCCIVSTYADSGSSCVVPSCVDGGSSCAVTVYDVTVIPGHATSIMGTANAAISVYDVVDASDHATSIMGAIDVAVSVCDIAAASSHTMSTPGAPDAPSSVYSPTGTAAASTSQVVTMATSTPIPLASSATLDDSWHAGHRARVFFGAIHRRALCSPIL